MEPRLNVSNHLCDQDLWKGRWVLGLRFNGVRHSLPLLEFYSPSRSRTVGVAVLSSGLVDRQPAGDVKTGSGLPFLPGQRLPSQLRSRYHFYCLLNTCVDDLPMVAAWLRNGSGIEPIARLLRHHATLKTDPGDVVGRRQKLWLWLLHDVNRSLRIRWPL